MCGIKILVGWHGHCDGGVILDCSTDRLRQKGTEDLIDKGTADC